MADNFSLGPLITVFVVLLVGLVFTSELADNQIENTQLSGVTNETVAISSGAGTLSQDDINALTFFGNATNNTGQASSLMVIGQTVNASKAGAVSLSSVFVDSSYVASYNYEGDLYVVDSKSHPLLRLIVIFFVIGLVAVAIGLFKKSGLF